MFVERQTYKKRYGDCDVPSRWEQNPRLANWVQEQRRNRQLSATRKALLTQLGFVWDTRDSLWDTRYAELAMYAKENGNCGVPKGWPQSLQLARWVDTQRVQFKKGNLSAERKARLDALGFEWAPKKGLKPSRSDS